MRRPAHWKCDVRATPTSATVGTSYACFYHEQDLRDDAAGMPVAPTRPDERDSAAVYCTYCEDTTK